MEREEEEGCRKHRCNNDAVIRRSALITMTMTKTVAAAVTPSHPLEEEEEEEEECGRIHSSTF